ncbi:hypothetical protein K2X33_12230 [bacterium]|nr:hypothetical protein [bacterium]
MLGWVFGVLCALSSLASASDLFLCRDYLLWLEAEERAAGLQARLAEPDLPQGLRDQFTRDLQEALHIRQLAKHTLLLAAPVRPGHSRWAPAAGGFETLPGAGIVEWENSRAFGIHAPQAEIRTLRFSHSGARVLMISADGGSVVLWDFSGEPVYRRLNPPERVKEGFFDWDDNIILLRESGYLARFQGADGTAITPSAPNWKVRNITTSGNFLGLIGVGSVNKNAKPQRLHFTKWDSYDFAFTHRVAVKEQDASLAVSHGGNIGALLHGGTLEIINIPKDEVIGSIPGFLNGKIRQLIWDVSTRYAIALAESGQIAIWDTWEKSLRRWELDGLDARTIATDQQGRLLVGGGIDGGFAGAIALVDLLDGVEIQRLRTEVDGPITALTLSENSKIMGFTGGKTSTLRLAHVP